MRILVIGESRDFEECKQKLGNGHSYSWVGEHGEAVQFLSTNELVVDFIIDEEPHEFEIYVHHDIAVLLNTCKISLGELSNSVNHSMQCRVFGFNGLPGFFNGDLLEVSLLNGENGDHLKAICQQLNTAYEIVDDRIGLVTPRVICMVINEAYFAVQEGTATREDIDKAMKLGTNYPYGPFEWSRRIGIRHVYELLEAIYDDTRDERYKICPLLKKEYLNLRD